MKQLLLLIVMFLVMVIPSFGQEEPTVDMDKEKAAIKQAALDYGEGWYLGDAERMQKALHPELIKRTPVQFPGGRMMIQNLGFSAMVEFSARNKGRLKTISPDKINIQILDATPEIATVKMLSPEFIDYIHLVKFNGEWKIINVLWVPSIQQPTPPPPVKKPEKLE